MKKTMKLGASMLIIIITSVVVAGVALNLEVIQPLYVITTENTFENINIEIDTDKDIYAVGENINVSVFLTNLNDYEKILYCGGWRSEDNNELFTYFHVTIYDINYTEIYEHAVPGKMEFFNYYPTTYTIQLNASSTTIFENNISWDQTAKNIYAVIDNTTCYNHDKQVPPGEYIIHVTVPLYMEHYFGSPYKEFYFGASKIITIR